MGSRLWTLDKLAILTSNDPLIVDALRLSKQDFLKDYHSFHEYYPLESFQGELAA